MQYNLHITYFALIIILLLSACADRIVTDSDFKYDLNRPGVAHVTPVDGALNVPNDIEIYVWFNKEMNISSVEENFFVYPILSMDTLRAITFEPENNEILYAAGKIHGIFRSENRGESWKWMTKEIPEISGKSVLVGPNESYIIAGTNDGLYISGDEGKTWDLNENLNEHPINHLISKPSDRSVVYAAVGTQGVYKSENGGSSWNLSSSGLRSGVNFPFIAVDPVDDNTLYVTTENDFIYKSINGADNWQQIRVGLSDRSFSSIIISKENPDKLYAGSLGGGVYKSEDAGENWEFTNDEFNEPVLSLAFDPLDHSVIYAGTEFGMYRSTDGGEVWNQFDAFSEEGAVFSIAASNNSHDLIITGFIDGAYVFNRDDNRFTRSSEIELDNILSLGTKEFEIWSDTLTVISPTDYHFEDTEVDTTTFSPFVPSRALQAWEAQGRTGDPPVDVDPDATKLTFWPDEELLNEFRYRILVRGSFEDGGNIPREVRGAEDIHGNSLETDSRSSFTIEP